MLSLLCCTRCEYNSVLNSTWEELAVRSCLRLALELVCAGSCLKM